MDWPSLPSSQPPKDQQQPAPLPEAFPVIVLLPKASLFDTSDRVVVSAL